MQSIRSAFAFVLLLTAAVAQADQRVDLVGQWGGCIHALAVRDHLAYVGIGPRLVVLDVSTPDQPVRLGQTELLGHILHDIVLDGSLAYVALHAQGMRVVDVSDPTHPRTVGTYPFADEAIAIEKHGDFVLLLGDDSGLNIIDVSSPESPAFVAAYPIEYSYSMTLAGDTAYVMGGSWLNLLDITNPAEPVLLSRLRMPRAGQIEVDGGYAFLSGQVMTVVDVTDPSAPSIAANLRPNPWLDSNDIALGSHRAYLAEDTSGMTVVDTTDPFQPVIRGRVHRDSTLGGALAAVDTTVYVGDWWSGIRIVDASDADAPVQVGFYDQDIAHSLYLTRVGDLMLSFGYRPGVQVLDVSNPLTPRRIAEWGDRRLSAAVLRGNTAYLGERGLTILDVSTPDHPVEIGRLDLDDNVTGEFAIAHGCAYLSTHRGGLQIVDVANPAQPRLISTVDNGPAYGVVVRGDRAFVSTYDEGLQIYDISQPHAPLLLGGTRETGPIYCVLLVDDVAYVAGNNGIRLVDVSDHTNPRLIPHSLPGWWGQIWRLSRLGDHQLLAPAGDGLRVLDISNPREPRLVANYTDQGWGRGVAEAGGYAYLATSEGGVEVLAIRPPGDLDGDDDVDLNDLARLLAAFGACAGDPAYEATADLDDDTCVSLHDLTLLLTHLRS